MSNITLRDYCQKIESLIDLGNYDEAIFHSLSILNVYPKYTAAYRNLGKALLEGKRYQEAFDIFSKVLSVFPDDFISHVGISAIKENDLDLEKSIWHMEQAFDSQPSNVVVQEELRRLLGRRDGVSPNKIRLSRGALIRMYLKGELYQQAIAEIHAFQKNDPSRTDLEVILAKIYSLTGRLEEAVEISRRIIGDLPYCYEPNKILSLHGDLAEKNTHRSRLIEIDPYYQFVNEQYLLPEDVPSDMVLIEQEVFNPPDHQEEEIPGWARQIGLSWTQDQPSVEEIPWSDGNISPFVSESPVESKPEILDENRNEQENLPDWMKNAGWTKETGLGETIQEIIPEEESNPDSTDQPIESFNAQPADALPSWMDDFRSEEIKPDSDNLLPEIESNELPIGDTDNSVPEWIFDESVKENNRQPIKNDFPPNPEEAEISSEPVDLPDWLKNYDVEGSVSDSTSETSSVESLVTDSTSETSSVEGLVSDSVSETSSIENEISGGLETFPTGEANPQFRQDGYVPERPDESLDSEHDEFIPNILSEPEAESKVYPEHPQVPQPIDETVPDWVKKILGGSSITSALREDDFNPEVPIQEQNEIPSATIEFEEQEFSVPSNQDNLETDIPEFITELPADSKVEGLLNDDTNEELISWLSEVSSEDLVEATEKAIPDEPLSVIDQSENIDLTVESLMDQEPQLETPVESETFIEESLEKVTEVPELDDRLTNLIAESPDSEMIDQWLNQPIAENTQDLPVESIDNFEPLTSDSGSEDIPLVNIDAEIPVDQNPVLPLEDTSEEQIQISSINTELEDTYLIPEIESQPSLIDRLMNELSTEPATIEKLRELGDAYFQENRFDEALDAYSQAEMLLITPDKE